MAQPANQQDAPPPLSDPMARYDFARDWWLYGDYEQVVILLTPLLLPEPPDTLENDILIDAYFMLGASHFFMGNRPAAVNPLYRLLLLEPDFDIDPFLYPPGLIRELNQIKDVNQEELDRIRHERAGGTDTNPGEIVYIERRIEERSIIVSMIPFGIGHFSNDEPAWGTVYLVTEVLLGATSLGFYLANELEFTPEPRTGPTFPDNELADTRQQLHIATGVAFWSLILLNIVHGLIIHEDVVEVSFGVVEEPDEPFELEDDDDSSWLPYAEPIGSDGFFLGIQRSW